jgi:hypothetical protein
MGVHALKILCEEFSLKHAIERWVALIESAGSRSQTDAR